MPLDGSRRTAAADPEGRRVSLEDWNDMAWGLAWRVD